MKVHFYDATTDDPEEMNEGAWRMGCVPAKGDFVAIDGRSFHVDRVAWDIRSTDADPVANVFLIPVRGPTQTETRG